MMGDAHDWYLHDLENRKHLQGIVSVQPKVGDRTGDVDGSDSVTPL